MTGTSSKVDFPRGERILAAVADAITRMYGETLAVRSRVDTDDILRTVTMAIAERLPVTSVAIQLKPDPETSRVVFADVTNPGMVEYLDTYVTSLLRPGEAPTYGLARKVIETGGPLLLPSITMDQLQGMVAEQARHFSKRVPIPVAIDHLSALMVPMRSGPAIIGTLGLFDWQGAGTLSEIDLEWMQRAADRVGITVENAQLRNKAVDRAERMAALSEVAFAISAGQDARATFKIILERLTATLRVDAADIVLVEEGGAGVAVVNTGFRSGFSADVRGRVPSESPSEAIEWIGQSRRWLLAREGMMGYSAAPLVVRDRFLGALEVFVRSELEPDPDWMAFLDGMAVLAAIALDNAAAVHSMARSGGGRSASARPGPAPDMSDRELQILRMVVDGASNREVAERLHLSQNTIKFHVRQLLEKAEVANRTELATRAVQQGWV